MALRSNLVATLVLWAAFTPVRAQTPAMFAAGSEMQMIAAAHAEAAKFQRKPSPSATDVVPRFCVDGYAIGPAELLGAPGIQWRSGEFTIGGQVSGRSGLTGLTAGRPAKVWWSPAHRAGDMPALVVRGRRIDNPTDTLRFESTKIAWPGRPGAPPVAAAERKYFFPSLITIPRPGRWLLIATSGANWGCFIVRAI